MTTTYPRTARQALPAWTARQSLSVIGNEVVKGLRLGWSERLQILIEMPLFVSFVLLLGYTVGEGDQIVRTGRVNWNLDSYHASWLFLGMGAYIFVYLLVQKMFWRLLAEIQTGTLEQTYLCPLPPWTHLVLGRPLASVVETTVVVGAIYLAVDLSAGLHFVWRFDALVPLLFLIVGAVGLALVVAGLAVVWKRIEMINDLVLLAMMFFSGSTIALDRMPAWTKPVSGLVFMTHSVAAMRTTLLDGRALSLWGYGGLAWLVVTGVGWLVTGVLVFRVCEHIVRGRGALTRY